MCQLPKINFPCGNWQDCKKHFQRGKSLEGIFFVTPKTHIPCGNWQVSKKTFSVWQYPKNHILCDEHRETIFHVARPQNPFPVWQALKTIFRLSSL